MGVVVECYRRDVEDLCKGLEGREAEAESEGVCLGGRMAAEVVIMIVGGSEVKQKNVE